MAGDVLNIKIFRQLKQRCSLTGKYYAILSETDLLMKEIDRIEI